jgi:uncharacterized protein YdhG (YjbR/CyaY superfamily)
MGATKAATTSVKTPTESKTGSSAFTAEERAAMKERAKEAKGAGNGESALLEKIGEMPGADKVIATRLHAIVKEIAPELAPRTWYGMPAYANKDGKVVCFFQSAAKFKVRYSTLGFSDAATLDDGPMWPTSFALTKLTASVEAEITELLKKARGG